MDIYMPMSTTARHNQITGTIFGSILALLKKREAYAMHEECSLVHWGKKTDPTSLSLVDSNEVICYIGKNRIDNQNLADVLVTRSGVEFDLRYLAI